jgi:hypothetical protein
MAEETTPNMMKVESIPFESIVDIKVSGAYYASLQQVFMDLAMSKTEAEFKTVMEKLKTNEKPATRYEFHLHTLFSLIIEIENEAKAQKKTVTKDVDLAKIKPVET